MKCYTSRPKIIYLSKKVQKYSMPNPIFARPDYDRGQCAESSYLKGAEDVCLYRLSTKLDYLAKLRRHAGTMKLELLLSKRIVKLRH